MLVPQPSKEVIQWLNHLTGEINRANEAIDTAARPALNGTEAAREAARQASVQRVNGMM